MGKKNETQKSVPELIRELGVLAKQLNHLDDEISAQISSLEESLRAAGLGIRVCVAVTYDEDVDLTTSLSFDKYRGQWRLLVEEGDYDDNTSPSVTPLSDCARDIRADMMAQGIPKLLPAALAQLTEKIEERRRAIEVSRELSVAIKGENR